MQIFAKNVTIRDDLPAVATEIKLEAGFTILFKSNFGTWKFNIYILNQFNKFWPNSKKKKEIIFSVSYMLAGEGGGCEISKIRPEIAIPDWKFGYVCTLQQ